MKNMVIFLEGAAAGLVMAAPLMLYAFGYLKGF